MDKSDADKASLLFFCDKKIIWTEGPDQQELGGSIFHVVFFRKEIQKMHPKTHDPKTHRTAIVYW